MSKAVDFYASAEHEAEQAEVEAVRQNLATHRGDPPPGNSPAVTQQAVKEAQTGAQVTPAKTATSQDRGGSVGSGTVDLQKQDLGARVGAEMSEKEPEPGRSVEMDLPDGMQQQVNEIGESVAAKGLENDRRDYDLNDLDKPSRDNSGKLEDMKQEDLNQATSIGHAMENADIQRGEEVQTDVAQTSQSQEQSSPAVAEYAPEASQTDKVPEPPREPEPEH